MIQPTQILLDRNQGKLMEQGLYADVDLLHPKRVNYLSLQNYLGASEPYVLRSETQPYAIAGRWGKQAFKVSQAGVKEIPQRQVHLALNELFRVGTANLYLIDAKMNEAIANKKYELLPAVYNGNKCFQIRAIKDFGEVRKGDLGGYIGSEENLSASGNCWIFDKASVFDKSIVSGDAQVKNFAEVRGKSIISGKCVVKDKSSVWDSSIKGNVEISGKASVIESEVKGNSKISNGSYVQWSKVSGNAQIIGDKCVVVRSTVKGQTKISENAHITKSSIDDGAIVAGSSVIENSEIFGNAKVSERATIKGSKVYDNAAVMGVALVSDGAEVFGNAVVNGVTWVTGKDAKVSGKVTVSSGEVTETLNESVDTLVVQGSELIKYMSKPKGIKDANVEKDRSLFESFRKNRRMSQTPILKI